VHPLPLAPQLMTRPYRGGARLAGFRHAHDVVADHCGEDWLASTTTVFGETSLGLTVLPDGRRLRDAVDADPIAFLGPEHTEVFGSSTGLLVKLIDPQQRLSVHVHPTRDFSRRLLGLPYGKTEAWYVLDVPPTDAAVHIGFVDDVDPERLRADVEGERGAQLLDRLHRVPVSPGDAIFVPAGTPHAIGEGVLLAEVQEPSDLLVRLEWLGYSVGSMPSDMGLGMGTALTAVDCSGWDDHRLRTNIKRHSPDDASALPTPADPFFRLSVRDGSTIDPPENAGFAVVVVLRGEGQISGDDFGVPIRSGDAYLVPFGAGNWTIAGTARVLVARPPDPGVARAADPELSQYLNQSPH
jgi:mannose-6-phosphate isomerase